jgi:hypothetical protein
VATRSVDDRGSREDCIKETICEQALVQWETSLLNSSAEFSTEIGARWVHPRIRDGSAHYVISRTRDPVFWLVDESTLALDSRGDIYRRELLGRVP